MMKINSVPYISTTKKSALQDFALALEEFYKDYTSGLHYLSSSSSYRVLPSYQELISIASGDPRYAKELAILVQKGDHRFNRALMLVAKIDRAELVEKDPYMGELRVSEGLVNHPNVQRILSDSNAPA